VSKIIARLTILSDSLSVEELVGLFEVTPAESWPRGFTPKVGVARKSAGVRYLVEITDGEVQLGRVLTPPSVERIIARSEHLTVELSIVAYVAETAGAGLSLESVRSLAAIRASVDMDIYASD
jgi:hypothetical protein